jgi:hypothetical protein
MPADAFVKQRANRPRCIPAAGARSAAEALIHHFRSKIEREHQQGGRQAGAAGGGNLGSDRLLDYLVGGSQQRFGLEVDEQLVFRRKLHREIAWLFAA